jgi:hypothetical protein
MDSSSLYAVYGTGCPLGAVDRILVSFNYLGTICSFGARMFWHNHHQMLLRQLFHIRQTTSVASYVEEFHQLVDQLNAYQTMPDPLCYTMKFVDGLHDEIKAVVMLQ